MATSVEAPVTFHLSLNVGDLGRAVEFYRTLFGREPAKRHDDYAKFDLDDPPVVFSLVPRKPGPGGSLSHIGLRVPAAEAVVAYRDRLAAAGVGTQEQNGTVCGYARQDKFWVKDPDGNFWEIYHVEEDVDPVTVRRSLDGPAPEPGKETVHPPGAAASLPVVEIAVWEHYVAEGLPERIPHDDGTLDEVKLTGSFNAAGDDAGRARLVAEAFRVLRPGGAVVVHGLMGDRPFPPGPPPTLPGLAALVRRVPDQAEPVAALLGAGFADVLATKYTDQPWFTHAGVGMREVKLVARRPDTAGDGTRHVLYKGPLEAVTDDGGQRFVRGQRVAVSEVVWQRLRLGPAADQFLFLDLPSPGCSA
jgi:catechol 2,3-dioxygenase-like lactoylglutathione lyase family enzyme